MAQIFATDLGWSQSYPMSCKSEAHEALGLLFGWEGVPPKMIIRGAKEMKLALSPTLHDPPPPSIGELKKGAARKLTRAGAPRQRSCFVLEYKSYI
ncbi:LOW QUALITY PROTEIN: hypothetical protein ACHAW6_009904 [Cyclotella cf. meneghiniana]